MIPLRLNLTIPDEPADHEQAVQRSYDKWAGALSRVEWYRDERVLSHLEQIASLKPKRVLELCAGSGIVLDRLARRMTQTEFFAVDISSKMCEAAATRCAGLPNVHIMQGDWLQSASNIGPFDVIIVKNALHLLRDLSAKLRELQRESTGVTRLVVIETVSPSQTSLKFIRALFSIVDPQKLKAHYFTKRSLLAILANAGWHCMGKPRVVNQLMSIEKWLTMKAQDGLSKKIAIEHITRAPNQIREEMNILFSTTGVFMLRRQVIIFARLSRL